jgi:hypothetical protein
MKQICKVSYTLHSKVSRCLQLELSHPMSQLINNVNIKDKVVPVLK